MCIIWVSDGPACGDCDGDGDACGDGVVMVKMKMRRGYKRQVASVCIIWVSDGPACADRVFVMQHPASSNTKCTTMQCAGDAKITPHQCHTLMPIHHCTLLRL